MRDTHATGIGSIMGAGTAGYCVGNLQLDGTPLPGEDASFTYPVSLASPCRCHHLCTTSELTLSSPKSPDLHFACTAEHPEPALSIPPRWCRSS